MSMYQSITEAEVIKCNVTDNDTILKFQMQRPHVSHFVVYFEMLQPHN